jgi:hypothetical protein
METNKTLARKKTRRSPMLTHETSPVSGVSVVGMTYGACQGPSYLPAGVPGVSTALPEGPAAPAAGWRLHRGEPEPGDEDKSPPTAGSPKVAWPQQDRQRQRTGVTNATTGLDQSAIKEASPRKDPRQREGICLPDASPRGKGAL